MGYTSYLSDFQSDLVVKKLRLENLLKKSEQLSTPFWDIDNLETEELGGGRVKIVGHNTEPSKCYDFDEFLKRLSKIVVSGKMSFDLIGEEVDDIAGYEITKGGVYKWGYKRTATKKKLLK